MFGKLNDMIKRGMALDLNKVMQFSFHDRDIQGFIIELNRDYQLFDEGIDREGNTGGYYSRFTEELNRGRVFDGKEKIEGERYFFYDTGEMFESFFIKVTPTAVIIGNTDTDKLDKVIENPDLLIGLTEESKSLLIEEILPIVRDELLNELLG